MTQKEGLVFAYAKSDRGAWREIGWKEINAWKPGRGLIWLHFDRLGEGARRYLKSKSGLHPVIAEALLAEETRPRAFRDEDCLFLVLRGVNLTPGADPDDMVALRLWVEKHRIISCRHRKVMAVESLHQEFDAGRGIRNSGAFLVELASGLIERTAPVIHDLDDACDALEEELVRGTQKQIRANLADIRREAIRLRRHLAPQREALAKLQGEDLTWLDAEHKARLREVSDRVTRFLEELDSIRERAAVIQDEVASGIAEQTNKNMYLLTIVATVLLPLGVITGLFGVNMDGMPGTSDTPWAFAAIVAALAVLVAIELIVLRWRKWI